jgi:hypothetical protein
MIPFASEKGVAKGWMLFQAFMIEILNRFGPVCMFWFVMGLGGYRPEEHREPEKGEGRPVVEHKPVPAPSIELPAVPDVEKLGRSFLNLGTSVEAAPAPVAAAFPEIEADEDPAPLPLPPSPRKRMKPRKQKPRLGTNGPGAVVILFKKRPTQGEVLALVASGKTQKEIASIFDCTDRTIRNILSGKREAENTISFPA